MILFWFCLIKLVGAMEFNVNDKNSFGPYTADFTKYELCERSQGIASSELILKQDILNINLTVTKPCILSKSKSRITVNTIKGGENKTLFRYNLKDPCQHFSVGPLLREMMSVKQNCKIEKGTFPITLNLTQAFGLFFGKSFFYGHYECKSVIRCTTGNLICIYSIVNIEKRKT